jgi:hypothetical protein
MSKQWSNRIGGEEGINKKKEKKDCILVSVKAIDRLIF